MSRPPLDFVVRLGFLAQPPAADQDGITSVALSVDPSDANANDLETQPEDTVTWNFAAGGPVPAWSEGTKFKVITIGQKTGNLLLTQNGFARGNDENFVPVESGDLVPPGVSNVYKLWGKDGDTKALSLKVVHSLPSAGSAYTYRIVLDTPSVGKWWIDPEIDICPP